MNFTFTAFYELKVQRRVKDKQVARALWLALLS